MLRQLLLLVVVPFLACNVRAEDPPPSTVTFDSQTLTTLFIPSYKLRGDVVSEVDLAISADLLKLTYNEMMAGHADRYNRTISEIKVLYYEYEDGDADDADDVDDRRNLREWDKLLKAYFETYGWCDKCEHDTTFSEYVSNHRQLRGIRHRRLGDGDAPTIHDLWKEFRRRVKTLRFPTIHEVMDLEEEDADVKEVAEVTIQSIQAAEVYEMEDIAEALKYEKEIIKEAEEAERLAIEAAAAAAREETKRRVEAARQRKKEMVESAEAARRLKVEQAKLEENKLIMDDDSSKKALEEFKKEKEERVKKIQEELEKTDEEMQKVGEDMFKADEEIEEVKAEKATLEIEYRGYEEQKTVLMREQQYLLQL